MDGDPRVRQLLEELLDSEQTPEEVCRHCPELLPEVDLRWRRKRDCDAELDVLFLAPEPRSPFGSPSSTPSSAEPPRIPGYEVLDVVGRGGMGVVYRARHVCLDRPVALKMLLTGAHAGRESRERFLREARMGAGLRHPNIVQVHDLGDQDGLPYFTMEFVEGGNLAQKLAGMPQPPRQAAALLTTLAGAVQAAHRNGIVHRDLKPANVLFTADGTPKIGDFGLARRLDGKAGLTWTGTVVGTPSYMAPEQARGERGAAERPADIYALGAMLYELLTGRPPFRAESVEETMRQLLSEEPVAPSRLNASVPRDLETICLKCLHKEPHLRYAAAAALAEDLHHFLRGEAITARPERWLGRLARRVRRRPVFSAAVAAGTLAMVGLVGGGLWLISERAADARKLENERTATERAAAADLREMVLDLNQCSWPEARAALERAKVRLGDHGSVALRHLLEQGARDLDLADRLDRARTTVLQPRPDRDTYEAWFRWAGLGQVGDDPEAVAARIRASNITRALVAALDYECAIAVDRQVLRWTLSVARRADRDPDPTGWRARARDPEVLKDPAALDEVIRTAPVADESVQLLLALERRLKYDSPERLPFLRRIQQARPGDFWANLKFADVLHQRKQPAEAIRYYQAAVAIRPGIALGYNKLGMELLSTGRTEEAVEPLRRAVDLEPKALHNHVWLAVALSRSGRYDGAIEHLRAAIGRNPKEPGLHSTLGNFLEYAGRYAEALPHYRQAVALAPNDTVDQNRLRALLVRLGRGDEARVAWRGSLKANPPGHDAWCGYAEFSLFLGQEDEYRRARRDVLARFGATTDPRVAVRAARACLLRPATEDELRQALALAERAAAFEPSKASGVDPLYVFARGLAEYRQGRHDRAIASMRGEAAKLFVPAAPRLVLAMALHRSGQAAEARQTLAAAVLDYDWRANSVNDAWAWILHVLRREAEGLILPDLPAFLEGTYQPRSNDERFALLGACWFADRTAAAARLYAAAYAADPHLAEDPAAGHRSDAARAAALAGVGRGEDSRTLGPEERARWSEQARSWLKHDLAALARRLNGGGGADRILVRSKLRDWLDDLDLARVRGPGSPETLPVEEWDAWRAFWKEVHAVLDRAMGG
jgi:serine/threonine-protein kinase